MAIKVSTIIFCYSIIHMYTILSEASPLIFGGRGRGKGGGGGGGGKGSGMSSTQVLCIVILAVNHLTSLIKAANKIFFKMWINYLCSEKYHHCLHSLNAQKKNPKYKTGKKLNPCRPQQVNDPLTFIPVIIVILKAVQYWCISF